MKINLFIGKTTTAILAVGKKRFLGKFSVRFLATKNFGFFKKPKFLVLVKFLP